MNLLKQGGKTVKPRKPPQFYITYNPPRPRAGGFPLTFGTGLV